MSYLIRSVRRSDSLDWLRLRNLLWEGDDHGAAITDYFAGTLVEPVEVLMAYDGTGTAVGHVELSIREDVAGLEGIRTGYVEGLYVQAADRSSGVALLLLRAAGRWAASQRCQAFASDRDDRVIIHGRFAASTWKDPD